MNKTIDDYIEHYGDYVDDFITSPFEHVDAWMIRDRLQKIRRRLTSKQKEKLNAYDETLIKNTKKMYHYMKRVHDFENAKDPLECWWWHLDKVLNGTLQVVKK